MKVDDDLPRSNTVTIYSISIVQMPCYIPWLPIFSSSGDRYCIISGVTPAETSINICRTENNILDNGVLRSVDYLLILQSTAANIFITRGTGIVRRYGPFPSDETSFGNYRAENNILDNEHLSILHSTAANTLIMRGDRYCARNHG